MALLRRRGVRGSEHELVSLARDQGLHALSVDLAGGYVARFLDGKASLWTPDAVASKGDAGLDPEVAALRVQERKLGRLTERYGEALRESDPASLALLQRVCLFRLGIETTVLASIFTGEDKAGVAGQALARLDAAGLRTKLGLLAEMKLLERDENERYDVHPAVRDGFLKSLDAETARRGHEAAREGLTTSLGGLPAEGTNPSDPATLDLLEEIVHHTLAAGQVKEAWRVYQDRIGGGRNLLWRLGAYERGERICRAFAGGRPPEEAPLPEGLSEFDQADLLNEWALYLKELGHLDGASRCYERVIEILMRQEKWRSASRGNLNLADALLLAGRLMAASEVAAEALRLAQRADDAEERRNSSAFRGYVRGMRGETSAAQDDFRDALHRHHELGWKDQPLISQPGYWNTILLARLGQHREATRLTEANKRIETGLFGPYSVRIAVCNLVLADLARERQDLDAARQLLDTAHEWAVARDAKEPLCWASKVRAKIALDVHDWKAARDAVEDGLRIARDCGFGLYHIDLMILRARVALVEGDVASARDAVEVALFHGVRPAEDSGLPVLLAATDPECGYIWGEEDGRALLAEIEEAEMKIVEYGGQVPDSPPTSSAPLKQPSTPESTPAAAASSVDVGIIVALSEEFRELHSQLQSPTAVKDEKTGASDYLFYRPGPKGEAYRCAATFVGGMGPTDAGLASERFLNRRGPRTIVLLGIAAGIHDDVRLGDIVLATDVGRYLERAKVVDDGESFEIHPGGDSFPCSRDLVRATQDLEFAHAPLYQSWREEGGNDLAGCVSSDSLEQLRTRNWVHEKPAFVLGPIASGPVVAASAAFVAWVRSTNRNYLGLEMESGGMMSAVYSRSDATRTLVLRGVSDFGDERKKDLDAVGQGGLRRYAMRNAVRLLWSLMDAGVLPQRHLGS